MFPTIIVTCMPSLHVLILLYLQKTTAIDPQVYCSVYFFTCLLPTPVAFLKPFRDIKLASDSNLSGAIKETTGVWRRKGGALLI